MATTTIGGYGQRVEFGAVASCLRWPLQLMKVSMGFVNFGDAGY